MTEIYFINDYYVETTSWHNAAKSWLKYIGDGTEVAFKAIDAMSDVKEIFKMLNMLTYRSIDRAGIIKEYYYFKEYEKPNEEDFEL